MHSSERTTKPFVLLCERTRSACASVRAHNRGLCRAPPPPSSADPPVNTSRRSTRSLWVILPSGLKVSSRRCRAWTALLTLGVAQQAFGPEKSLRDLEGYSHPLKGKGTGSAHTDVLGTSLATSSVWASLYETPRIR